MKAVVLAGGRGSRFEPYTLEHPKALYPVLGQPMVMSVINALPESIDEVIVVVNYEGQQIIDTVGPQYNGKKILYVWQDARIKGTWPAVYAARDMFASSDELFLVVSCDDIFDTCELDAAIAMGIPLFGIHKKILPAKYHGIRLDNDGFIVAFERHSNHEREELVEDVFACGMYILPAEIFSFEPQQLIDGEFGLPQTLLARYPDFKMKAFTIKSWFGLNTPAEVIDYEQFHEIQNF